jgi:hypothetical protein
MFDQHDITTSQLLVTSFDFASPERCQTLRDVMEQILHLGIVPLLNENDAVSGNQGLLNQCVPRSSVLDTNCLEIHFLITIRWPLLLLVALKLRSALSIHPPDSSLAVVDHFDRC